jgi:hypothetical protein
MGCRIMHDREQNIAALYCSTSDVAFGPLFNDGDFQDCYERAEAFLRWIIVDPREYDQSQLVGCYSEWLAQEEEQYKRENPPRCYDCGEPVGACGDDCPSKVKA